ncbi:MAG: DsrE family protein [Nocardiopsaceae bacterium]|nr:DsrE family protein [Nocardiopsaceae bacterium]
MTHHLLLETQGPWRGPGCGRFIADGEALSRAGEEVSLVLLQDGVIAAAGTAAPGLAGLLRHGGRVWVDEFSLEQRGLTAAPLVPGHELVGMDVVAAALLDPDVRAVWH